MERDAEEARNGQEALALLDRLGEDPCLALVDMMMPVMDGADLLRALKATGRLGSVPVVLVSAATLTGTPEGVRRFVQKPLSTDVLLQVVEEF